MDPRLICDVCPLFIFSFQECKLIDSGSFVCPSPEITLPENITDVQTQDDGKSTTPGPIAKRSRYQINQHDYLEFHLGLQLDGVKTYNNVSETLPEYGKINVFMDPQVSPIPEGTRKFRPFWPFSDTDIYILVSVYFVCLFVRVTLTPLFSTCRPHRDRQKPANRTQCPTLMTES